MKITILLVLLISFGASASIYSQNQRVSMQFEDATILEVLNEIKTQTGLRFIFNEDKIEGLQAIDLDVGNITVEEVLSEVFEETDLECKFQDDVIMIVERAPEPVIQDQQQQKEIKGTVTDDKGLPLPGVSVVIKGSNTGVSTDFDGNFSLELPDGEVTLVFSFIGMQPQEVLVTNQTELNITLTASTEQLAEVVVTTGYQKIDRKLFTGSATVLKAEEAKVAGVADVGRMLEGKVAGVSVQNVSGTFGAAPKIRVRGASSIYGDTKPLWVVDGVVLEDVVDISPDQLSSGDAATLISSSVAGINADDIESFQILKDASATALYGARAMNGVIVITTKKGRAGKNSIRVTSEFTMKMKPNYANYDILNSQDQMEMFLEMEENGWLSYADVMRSKDAGVFHKMYSLIESYENGKYGLEHTDEAKAGFLRRYERANTDWFDVLFRNSLQQNHSVSFSGGSETSKFYVSTSWLNDEGWTIADRVDRYTVNMRGDFDVTDKLTVGVQTKGSIREQKTPGTFNRSNDVVSGNYSREFDINPFSYALNTTRTITPYDENGNLEYVRMNYAPFNILEEYKNNYINLDVLDLSIQADLGYKFNKHLEYKFTGSMRYVKSSNEHIIKEGSNVVSAYNAGIDDPVISDANKYLWRDITYPNSRKISVLPNGGFYNKESNTMKNFYIRNMLNFNKTYNEIHSVNVMLGQELKYVDRQSDYFNGYGYQYNRGGTVFTDPNIIKSTNESGFSYFGMQEFRDRFVAAFANFAYSYKGKYTFNGTARVDGSNQLGQSKSARYLPTWNLSGKWNAKEEAFLYDVEWLSNLSFRGTYGLTASMGPANNASIVYRNAITTTPYDSEKQNAMFAASLENSELTWEKQYETNVGFDMSLFNRISLSVDAYQRKGFDLIAFVRTSGVGGEGWKFANYADMTSKGIEFSLGTRNVVGDDFNWTSNLTFAFNKNEITNLKNRPIVYDLVKAEGGALQGGPVRGLYSIPFAGLNEYGLPTFYDENGNITTQVYFQDNAISHLKYEGSIDPKVTGGFSNIFEYKNWKLNVFCSYQFGNKIRLYPSFHASYSDMDAITKDMKNRWLMPGDEEYTNIPVIASKELYDKYGYELESTYNAYNYSDQRVAKGDFIRLKEVSLEYRIPKKFLSKLGLSSASLKAQGTNLWLMYSDKALNGQDPEFFGTGGVALPVPKQYTFSLKLGF
ncbi:SusC/RagA family TonB-linked outer membrane protein [Marinifilum flexuosum]|uniref:TonB-linked SusC/RagA family outer membrane protein n=1 Tax=Marinifilum flexuosum TaxID=1117708 RepID=A0A419X9K5_9BACT|nr:SusC/RagA family TonB-linked outer membrane protein [Marinifilum flexuosum]RKE04326.1 TonB-linked SusC/RagA family outer membrane protein [Marinifilum flexuosum]